MSRPYFEDLRIYQMSEELGDKVWGIVMLWDHFAKDTVGKQLVRAVDSVGANIAEGSGHESAKEKMRYTRYARASLFETLHWLRRAFRRNLLRQEEIGPLKQLLMDLLPQISAYLNYLKNSTATPPPSAGKEQSDDDPFSVRELVEDYSLE